MRKPYKVLEIFAFDAARIYLLDEDGEGLTLQAHKGFSAEIETYIPTNFKLGEGITGKVFETGRHVFFEDIRNNPKYERMTYSGLSGRVGFRSTFHIPIGVKGKTVGVANFLSRDAHRFAPNEIQLMHSLVGQIGVAVQNAQLYEQTKRQAVELEQDITERKRTEVEISRYMRRLETLQEINMAILEARSHEAIAQAAMRHIHELIPCLRASVVEFDLTGNKGRRIAVDARGETKLGVGMGALLEAFGSLDEFRRGRVHVVEDILNLPQTPMLKVLGAEGVRSYINVPLISHGELIGSLNLSSDSPGTFSTEELEIANEVADTLAVAIREARLVGPWKEAVSSLFRLGRP